MLNLYIKPYCPYCARVIVANETIHAPLEFRDVTADSEARAALLAKGGKSQVPFLDDTTRGVCLYESDDIITYLHDHYGVGVIPQVPATGNVCPID